MKPQAIDIEPIKVAEQTARRFSWQADLLASKHWPRAKVVGLVLAAHVNDARGDFIAWPGQPVLAKGCGATVRFVRSGLKELQLAGRIEAVAGKGGGGRGCTVHYKLLFSSETKPYTTVPRIKRPKKENPAPLCQRPAPLCQEPGTVVSETLHNGADELTKELTKEPKKNLGQSDTDERFKTAESEFHLPGINYSSTLGIEHEQLPDGMVRKASDDKSAWNFASHSAAKFLGYEQGDKPNGKQPDEFVMAFVPPAALAEMLARGRAGTLRKATVALAMLALGVPRGQHIPEPAAMHVAVRATDETRLDHRNLKPQRTMQ